MTWNYRIMRHRQEQAEWFAIHEVYYNEQGTPVSVTQGIKCLQKGKRQDALQIKDMHDEGRE